MSDDFFEFGTGIPSEDLSDIRAVGFLNAIEKFKHASFLRSFKHDDHEGIEFVIFPEIFSRSSYDILKEERTCVVFSSENECPEVYALRKNFPRELLHINMTSIDSPVSLCLFETPYSELKYELTPEKFLLRIFFWYSRASEGTSHLSSQPLEPFVRSSTIIIAGDEIFKSQGTYALFATQSKIVYTIENLDAIPKKERPQKLILAIPIKCEPWHSTVINYTPKNLLDLNVLLKKCQVDLIGKINEFLKHSLYGSNGINSGLLSQRVLLMVLIPKKRHKDDTVESEDNFAFILDVTIEDLALKFDVIQKAGREYAKVLSSSGISEDALQAIKVEGIANVNKRLTKNLANKLAGLSTHSEASKTVIGVGALGSHVVNNLLRQGIGNWKIVDYDMLLPHNHSRYGFSSQYEGLAKSNIAFIEATYILGSEAMVEALPEDIMSINQESENYNKIFKDSQRIYDFSVNKAVTRHLSLKGDRPPITCSFMTQNGRYLALLSEDDKKTIRLDDIEIQLYAACLQTNCLNSVFVKDTSSAFRYSGSCSDITTVLSQDNVALHGALLSTFIKKNPLIDTTKILLWEYDDDSQCMQKYDISPVAVHVSRKKGWEIRISHNTLLEMQFFRQEKLPNETGGVLLGMFDFHNKIIYVGAVLPSPKDSEEWPTSYIRGCSGLVHKIKKINEISGGHLSYVGEWHSHPGASNPSRKDYKALESNAQIASEDGCPAFMLIQGNTEKPNILLKQL